MKNLHSRGEFSLGKIIVFLIIAATGWLGFEFSKAYVNKSRIETILTTINLQLHGADDETIAAKVASEVERQVGLKVSPNNVVVYRTSDGKRMRIDVSYLNPIRLMEKGFDLSMEASASEANAMKL